MASKTSARTLIAAERAAQAWEMKKSGATYEEIANTLGVTPPAVYKMVKKRLDRTEAGTAESMAEQKQLELERLEALNAALWPTAMDGDVKAVTECRNLSAERRKLLGLDAATKTELSGPNGGAIKTESSGYDLTKLALDELQELERLLANATSPTTETGNPTDA